MNISLKIIYFAKFIKPWRKFASSRLHTSLLRKKDFQRAGLIFQENIHPYLQVEVGADHPLIKKHRLVKPESIQTAPGIVSS